MGEPMRRICARGSLSAFSFPSSSSSLFLMNDLRHAIRTLLKSPGFTTAAVLTLALGIGANTAIFQLIDAVALRPLPIPNPHELVEVRIVGGNRGFGLNPDVYGGMTRPAWQELRDHQQALTGMFAWSTRQIRVGERNDLRTARGIEVSGEFFSSLGVQPYRGRLIQPADEATACPANVAVVSHDYWQRQMGSVELVPSTRLRVNLELVDVVGVTPPGFFGVAVGDSFDIAQPLCQPMVLRRDVFDVAVMGRLRPGWTVERASAHLNALSAGIFDETAPTDYSAESIKLFKTFRLGAYQAASGVSSLRTRYETSLQAPVRHNRPHSSDGLRKPCEPDAGSCERARPRGRRPGGHGRVASGVDSPVSCRKLSAGRRWSHPRCLSGRDIRTSPARGAYNRTGRTGTCSVDRLARADVRDPCRLCNLHCLRPRAGHARDARATGGRDEGRRPRNHCRSRTPVPSAIDGDGADRHGAGDARLRAPVRSELPQSDDRRHRTCGWKAFPSGFSDSRNLFPRSGWTTSGASC